jgi:hypothetical protein
MFAAFSALAPGAQASLSASRLADGRASQDRAQDLEAIRQALEQDIVSQRLQEHGLTPQEVEAKLPALDDRQIHQIASLSHGVGQGGVLGLVIGVLLVVLLVVVILRVAD